MNRSLYSFCRYAIRFIRMQCLTTRSLHLDRLNRDSPFLIAVTHISHLEPMLLSSMVDFPIRWIARTEYYRRPLARKLLNLSGSIPIQRTGQPPVRAIRSAISHLKNGDQVGIFPEGGVMRRQQAIFRKGVNKGGACLIAMRARVPILPVVMLGTEKLNAVAPWFPGSGYALHVGVGQAVFPAPFSRINQRQLRRQLTTDLSHAFGLIYSEMLHHFDLRDEKIP